jgi:hypothetical protein
MRHDDPEQHESDLESALSPLRLDDLHRGSVSFQTIGFLHDEPAAQGHLPSGYDVRGQVKALLGVVANLREGYERTSAIGLFLALHQGAASTAAGRAFGGGVRRHTAASERTAWAPCTLRIGYSDQ